MRLDELEEAEVKKAVFTFGRLNPPHFGHHALIQTLQKAAQKQNCDWFLFVSAKTGDKKNPLTYEQKVWWIQTLFPETKGHLIIDPSIKTPLVAATWLYKKGYRAATFVAGEDDMSSYGEMIKSSNAHGQANPDAVKAGKGFIFNPLDFAISPRLASATNARKNVTDGDPEAFVRSILGPKINPKLAELVQHQLYPTLRKSLGLGESVGESEQLNKHTPNVKELAKKFMTTSDTVHRQLARGVKVEFEHTNDIEVATEIAMDHLGEKLDYYTRLAKAENETADPKKKFGENFADGKGPGRPGDSQRHGIPKKATISQLEKASHAKGRKGQLARWQLNMRRGKKRANEEVTNEVADQPYRFISPVSTATTQKSMFQTDSGTTIQVFIQVDTGNGVADIGFFDATDKENPTIGMTGKGDAFRVFATVGSIVKQFVAKRKPPYISFSGKSSDAGRIKLYDMIAKNIGRYLPEYKLIDSGFVNGDKGYTFKRVAQESVSEVAKVKLSSDPNNFGAWVNDSGKPEKTIMIPINKLSGFEPDSKFDEPSHAKNLANIVKAIKAGKELPPILVRRHGIDRFQVLDGHHRFKAYRMAGMKSIPARLVDPKNVSEESVIKAPLLELRGALIHYLKQVLPTWPEYVVRDWIYNNNKVDFGNGADIKSHLSELLKSVGLTPNSKWTLVPNLKFTMDMFEPWTQGELKNRAGGAVKDVVARDAERHATQATLAQQQGGVRKEPVILIKHPDGYELQEGWHRTIQHFAQFPNGYTGPAWIAESQTSESWSPMELAIMEGGHLLEEFDSGENTNEDELIKPRVYLDMDGVLADFFSEWSRLAGVKHYKDINNTEETLQLVREHPTFWIDLPMLPHARALVKTVIEKYGEYRICSTPLAGDERSKPGKIAWIKKHLSDMPPAEIVLTHSKADHALGNGVANILVDDYGVNVNKWRAAGGIGIKYDDSAFDHVAKILGSIAKSGVSK